MGAAAWVRAWWASGVGAGVVGVVGVCQEFAARPLLLLVRGRRLRPM